MATAIRISWENDIVDNILEAVRNFREHVRYLRRRLREDEQYSIAMYITADAVLAVSVAVEASARTWELAVAKHLELSSMSGQFSPRPMRARAYDIDRALQGAEPYTIIAVIDGLAQRVFGAHIRQPNTHFSDNVRLGVWEDQQGRYDLWLRNGEIFVAMTGDTVSWELPTWQSTALRDIGDAGHYTRILQLLLEAYQRELVMAEGLSLED